jgi:hypothetical protein
MKYLSLALGCTLMLSACGGSDESYTPVPPSPAIAGLWQASSIDDINDNFGSVSIPAGELYMALANAEANPVDATLYSRSTTANCLERSSDQLTHVGSNRYRDRAGDTAVLTANGSTLSMTMTDEGMTMRMLMNKVTTLSESDLQVCGVQNDGGALVLSDDSSGGLVETVLSALNSTR